MVGCNLDLIPMVNEFQLRFGLLGGEVCMITLSCISCSSYSRCMLPASDPTTFRPLQYGLDLAAKLWTRKCQLDSHMNMLTPIYSEEQAEAFHGFLSKLTPEARAWWDEYVRCFAIYHSQEAPNTYLKLPSYMAFANRVLGEGFKKASWHLQLIGTAPRHQRKGLARALVKTIDDRVRITLRWLSFTDDIHHQATEAGINLTVETQKAINVCDHHPFKATYCITNDALCQVTIYEKFGFTKRGELDVVGPFNLGTAKLYCFEKQP